MKKFLVSVLSIIILSSCNRVDFQPDFPVYYSGKAEVTCDDMVYSADVSYENEVLNITVTSPSPLEGFVLTVENGEITVNNDSLTLKYDKTKIQELFPIASIYDVMVNLNIIKPEFKSVNDTIYAEFKICGKDCVVSLDKESKKIELIKYNGMIVDFGS